MKMGINPQMIGMPVCNLPWSCGIRMIHPYTNARVCCPISLDNTEQGFAKHVY